MAAFQDKMMVDTAIVENTRMDLSCDYITTGSFFEVMPVYIKEMVPGESIKIQSEEFTRMQPLNVPTFGRGNVNTRGFFVPMRTIMKQWNNFIVDTIGVAGDLNSSSAPSAVIPSNVYAFPADMITEMFLRQCGVTGFPTVSGVDLWGTSNTTQPASYDLSIDVAGTIWYLILNVKGRRVKKVLESLGYKILPFKYTAVGTYTTNEPTLLWSAMPMLAVAKIYLDWYINSGYGIMYEDALWVQRVLNNVNPSYNTFSSHLSLSHLLNFIVSANYDSDYFVSAWDNPVNPNAGAFSTNYNFKDITVQNFNGGTTVQTQVSNAQGTGSGGVVYNGYNTPIFVGTTGTGGLNHSGALYQVSQYVHDALKSLTDYQKRNALVGVHAFDRFLARFGKALSDEQLDRSKYLGAHKGSLQVGDIMSTTTNTGDGKGLGAFAGKGISYDKGNFEYSTNEYGFIVLLSTIIPSVGYYQGIDRNILHVNRLDYWQPEFDNLGTQTINAMELYIPTNGSSPNRFSYMTTFGFTPRYSEYKFSKDRLTGDFTLNSFNANGDLDAWHFMRKFNDTDFADYTYIVHNKEFVTGATDGDQYNRIFQTWNSKAPQDMFWMIWHFNVISNAPMKSMYDVYDFEEKGKKVIEEVNGVKMN